LLPSCGENTTLKRNPIDDSRVIFKALADKARNRRVRVNRTGAWPAFRPGLLAPCLVGALLAMAQAWPAQSAELVEIRVGRHPTFTRVVFEFDAPTGYRVERRAEGEAENTIVVTLDASSRARSISSGSLGVKSVSVEEGLDRAVARIIARKPGLPIKEMILRDPPRVVLDLMIAAPAPKVSAPEVAPAPEPVPEPALAQPAPVAEPTLAPVVVKTEPEPPPVEPEPAPAPAESEFEPAEIAEPAVAPEFLVAEVEEEAAELEEEFVAAEEEVVEAEEEVAEAEEEVVEIEEAARVVEAERVPEADTTPALPRSPEADAARRRAAEARRRMAPAAESQGAPFDIKTVGAAAGGVLVLLLVVFVVVRRRRSLPNDMDVTALAADDEVGDAASDDDRIPQGGFSMDAPLGGEASPAEDFEFGAPEAPSDENKPIESIATGAEAGSGLFDESPQEKESTTMENQEMPITHMDSEAPTRLGIGADVGGAGGDSEITRIVQELERRVAHLETRLDESNEARERLERQVAAQSEELRVQRAAIARTQRALRSLNRSEEEQATEPALRDPSKPTGAQ
jgi:hypothetical protein